jgi:hypothetical protein
LVVSAVRSHGAIPPLANFISLGGVVGVTNPTICVRESGAGATAALVVAFADRQRSPGAMSNFVLLIKNAVVNAGWA